MKAIILVILFWSSTLLGYSDHAQEAKQLYQRAYAQYKNGNYKEANSLFYQVIINYPFSEPAMKAQIYSAQSYYKNKKYIDSATSATLYLKSYPNGPYREVAQYLHIMSNYALISQIDNDQETANQTLKLFDNYVFKQERLHRKLKKVKSEINNHLASAKMRQAYDQLSQINYLAAIFPLKAIIKEHPESNLHCEALFRLGEIFSWLGINSQAKFYLARLAREYPKSEWKSHALYLLGQSQG